MCSEGAERLRYSCVLNILANTRSPEAPAEADIHLHVSPRPASASNCACAQPAHGPARLYVSQPLLSDECPPTYSTGSLALAGCALYGNSIHPNVTVCRAYTKM